MVEVASPNIEKMGNGECCASVADELKTKHPYFAQLLNDTGLVETIAIFRGTLFIPSEEALRATIDALGFSMERKADL